MDSQPSSAHPNAINPAVCARNFSYHHAGRRRPALVELSFDIQPGEKVLLLGASGAGKSTLLAAIAGVLGDDTDGTATGQLLVHGAPAAASRGVVGLVLQDPDSQTISARVGDDVAFGAENLGTPRDEIEPRVRHALEVVGLEFPLDHPTAQLSGGQKQRLALAGVLAMGAEVICLDEPTANIDPEAVPRLRDAAIAAAEASGATLIVVEHRVDAWVDHVDRIMVLGHEGLLADGSPKEVLSSSRDQLAQAGVWIPGHPPQLPSATPVSTDALPTTQIALQAQGLAVGYGAKKSWFTRAEPGQIIARDINFSIPRGASTCIVGPNGSGKSTLALTLGGLLEPFAGTVEVSVPAAEGLPHHTMVSAPWTWSSTTLARRIGTVFQDPEHQFVSATVRQELELGPSLLGLDASARVDELLERLRLTALAKANPFSLSGGEKRRLAVATMLATAPDIVILDEPTFGQDRATFKELVQLLRLLADEGRAIISITHDPLVVAALGDCVIDMATFPSGRRQAAGSKGGS